MSSVGDADAPTSRVVLVTGAARGIGLACARAFADRGDRVAITYRSTPPTAADADRFLCLPCDVTDTGQVEQAFDQIEQELGPVEVLVSNAGITRDTLAVRMKDPDFEEVIETNLTGGFRVARRAITRMIRARRGRIIFVSSIVGATGQAGQANYASSKAGLIGLARSLARELATRHITVNVIAPGPVDTDMMSTLSDERRAAIAAAVPLGRFGHPEEVAAAACFLASEEAGYITGTVLAVDGGLGMGVW